MGHTARELARAFGDGENVKMTGKHGKRDKGEVVAPLGAAEDAEQAVVEDGAGLEQEASLDGPAGDGDEGVRVGDEAKFSGHTL